MNTNFSAMLHRAKEKDVFWVESAILEVTEEIVHHMERQGVSKSDLAKKLGKKPSFVTKLLSGNNNFTLQTLVKIGRSLNCEYRCHFQPAGTTSEWIDFLHEEPTIVAVQPAPSADVGDWWKATFPTVLKFQPINQTNEPLASVA